MGKAVVRGTASAAAPAEAELIEPTFLGIFRAGAPGFLRDGFVPLGAFYGGLQLGSLAVGIGASAAVSLLVYLYDRRARHEGLLVRLSLAFVLVQSAIGLASDSTTVYLAQPVLVTAVWGCVFLGSIPLGRPLAGALACAWYPFPSAYRETPAFKRVFRTQSLAWAAYFLARSALRLAILLHGSLESFFAISFVTGTPLMLLLLAWSIRHAIRGLSD